MTHEDEIENAYGRFAQIPLSLLAADPKVVSNTSKVLYAWLWRYSEASSTRTSYPGRRALAEHLGASLDTVDRAVKQLVAFGAIAVTARIDDSGDRTSNLYRILVIPADAGGRNGAATQPHERGDGGRMGAATVAAPEGEDQEPLDQEPIEEISSANASSIVADASATSRGSEFARPLCDFLITELQAIEVRTPESIPKPWLNAARLLIDRDGRDPHEARDLIRWACRDSFWRSNIHSMPKFREKFDMLRLQSQRTSGQRAPSKVEQGRAVAEELRRELEAVGS